MNLEEFQQHLTEMNEDELMTLIHDLRRNREQSMNVTRIKAVKKKTKEKSLKSALADLTDEQKQLLIEKFLGKDSK